MIVDVTSGIMEMEPGSGLVQDGQQVSYDAAFGIEDPDGAILLGIDGFGDLGAAQSRSRPGPASDPVGARR